MGKTGGFLEYERKNNQWLPPLERIENFAEFRVLLSEDERRTQAARCMNCGVPFCQSGMVLAGMATGCPLHNLIPEWNDELYKGHYAHALSRLLKTNNFPEFTGRVCPALCEAACTCGLNGKPVSVHDNELSIVEYGFDNGLIKPFIPQSRSGKTVAVIGSGPAGLAVADVLNRRGHSVTVFERDGKPGGLLMYGIPNMKLDKEIVRRRINLMRQEGVEFLTGVDVGADGINSNLSESFDAVALCCGAKKARDIKGENRNAEGIYFAVDYLSSATKFVIGETTQLKINARDKNVVIVGGGDTGNDCVGTAIRQGASTVTQLEIMPKLPDTRADGNDWPQWPRVSKTDYGQEEAIAVFGEDPRLYRRTVKRFIAKDGRLTGVEIVTVESKTEGGKRIMVQIEGSEQILPCELLLIAAGFSGCESYVAESFKAELNGFGTLACIDGTHQIGGNVFAAGDVKNGQSLVVKAIADGRACANEIDGYLMQDRTVKNQ